MAGEVGVESGWDGWVFPSSRTPRYQELDSSSDLHTSSYSVQLLSPAVHNRELLWQVGFWLWRAPPSAKPPCNHFHLFTVSSPQFYSRWQPDVLTWAAAVLCIEQYDGVILQLGRTDQTAELGVDDGDSSPCRHHVVLFVPSAHQHTYV